MIFGSSREYPLGKNFAGRVSGREFAEISRHAQQVLLREALIAKQQNGMVEPCLVNILDDVRIEDCTQINAANFGADILGERNYIEPGPGCDVHDDPRWQMMMIGNCVSCPWKRSDAGRY